MRRLHLSIAVALFGILALGRSGQAQEPALPENFTANAIVSNNIRSGAGVIQMRVTRWTASTERERFVSTLQSKGPEALLELLRESPRVGNIRTPDALGYPLHYAHERDADGVRHIVLATDRPIGFWEQMNQPRTIDYPFTVVQLEIGENNRGKGTISYASKITARGDTIEIENFANAPIMLSDVRSDKRPR